MINKLLTWIKGFGKKSRTSSIERWDMQLLAQDCEHLDFTDWGKALINSKPCFKWILTTQPEILCFLAMLALKDELVSILPKIDKEGEETPQEGWPGFIKFMKHPGAEVILTEAAYRGYLPAMSMLASHYDNEQRTEEARYWKKFGCAFLNPTSLLLRGLDLMIEGKLNQNDTFVTQGHSFLDLAYMLGENKVCELPHFNKRPPLKKPLREHKNNVMNCEKQIMSLIKSIDDNNYTRLEQFLEKTKGVLNGSGQKVPASDLIQIIMEINDILDDPDVKIIEISTLWPLRNDLVNDIKGINIPNEPFEKAELSWKYHRTTDYENSKTDSLLSMIIE